MKLQLSHGGHFLPLPKEPAALANVVEVAIVDFLIETLDKNVVACTRGTERGYPDIEIEIDGEFFAVDVKVARRAIKKNGEPSGRTDSRITLYTGNTFFMYPTLKWPGTFRPFADYVGHIDIIALYTLDHVSPTRIKDFELVVVEPWRIGSKSRSSTTREYLGAVDEIARLRAGNGEFATSEEFYAFWRKHPWKIGKAVQQQLQKLIAGGSSPKP
ncbi:type II restriction endonuclease [Caulobacter segnis]